MGVKHAGVAMLALFVLTGCFAVETDAGANSTKVIESSDEVTSTPTSTPTVAPTERPTQTPTAPPTEENADPDDLDQTSSDDTALAVLALLAVKGRAPMTGYDRARFGQAWLDADRNGCDTRNDVLGEHLRVVVRETNGCVVTTGTYDDPYTGARIDFRRGDGNLIDIDHVVAMGNAWATGAEKWPIRKRAAFANDPLNLLPADAGANRQKSDGDAATWLPAYKPFRCEYVARQVAVKQKYGLWVTAPEKQAISRVLGACPDQSLPQDVWAAPTVVDHDITDPGVAEPEKSSTPTPESAPKVKTFASVHFENCDAARAAGAAPVHRGDPGYGTHLDRDGDGVGCE